MPDTITRIWKLAQGRQGSLRAQKYTTSRMSRLYGMSVQTQLTSLSNLMVWKKNIWFKTMQVNSKYSLRLPYIFLFLS